MAFRTLELYFSRLLLLMHYQILKRERNQISRLLLLMHYRILKRERNKISR